MQLQQESHMEGIVKQYGRHQKTAWITGTKTDPSKTMKDIHETTTTITDRHELK